MEPGSSSELSSHSNPIEERPLFATMLILEACLHAMECKMDNCSFAGCDEMKLKVEHVNQCSLDCSACDHHAWDMYLIMRHWEECQNCRYCSHFKSEITARRNPKRAKVNLDNYNEFKSQWESDEEDEILSMEVTENAMANEYNADHSEHDDDDDDDDDDDADDYAIVEWDDGDTSSSFTFTDSDQERAMLCSSDDDDDLWMPEDPTDDSRYNIEE